MSGVGKTVRAYVELSRLSNIPTCLTNVLVGCALGGAIQWQQATMLTIGVMLMYVAGMALNDVFDARIDKTQRPERPIPSGRVSHRAALAYGSACLALGIGATAMAGVVVLGSVLALAILLYDLLHHRVAVSVTLMGVCRGLIYVLAAAAVAETPDWARVAWFAASRAT